jgi:hypothetical protein
METIIEADAHSIAMDLYDALLEASFITSVEPDVIRPDFDEDFCLETFEPFDFTIEFCYYNERLYCEEYAAFYSDDDI